MDYDGEEDARSSLLVHLNGRLEGESRSIGNGMCVLFALVIGCRISLASMRQAY